MKPLWYGQSIRRHISGGLLREISEGRCAYCVRTSSGVTVIGSFNHGQPRECINLSHFISFRKSRSILQKLLILPLLCPQVWIPVPELVMLTLWDLESVDKCRCAKGINATFLPWDCDANITSESCCSLRWLWKQSFFWSYTSRDSGISRHQFINMAYVRRAYDWLAAIRGFSSRP